MPLQTGTLNLNEAAADYEVECASASAWGPGGTDG
jgi:hypothetical protein